jgi:SAM-dependent methyltransferase
MNRLLNDKQREKYKDVIDHLFSVCPEMMNRKFPRANVQQAFVYDTVKGLIRKPDETILCVGAHEDTAAHALLKQGISVHMIDPVINEDLDSFFNRTDRKFHIIFSTSVIEHVHYDEVFLSQICQLLLPGGFGVLTCDFRNDYKPGDPKPGEDARLYTIGDLLGRLYTVLAAHDCDLYGEVDYSGEPDFEYGGAKYSFATYVFKKKG